MDNRITSTTMLQVLAAATALTIVGYLAVTYAFARGATMVIEPVYAQSNALQAVSGIAAPNLITEQEAVYPVIYQVQKRDSLHSIAMMTNTPLEHIRQVNGLHNDTLQPGQFLALGDAVVGGKPSKVVSGFRCERVWYGDIYVDHPTAATLIAYFELTQAQRREVYAQCHDL